MTGEKELMKELENLSSFDLGNAVGKGISFVQEAAKSLCPVNDGELRESIFTTFKGRRNEIEGICYTNKGHASPVEFGAGPKGQASHEGISPEVAVSYTQSPWWIHESQIDKATAEKYHFFAIETKQGIFYRSSGQAAQPFMYPALANNIDKVTKIVAGEARKDMK